MPVVCCSVLQCVEVCCSEGVVLQCVVREWDNRMVMMCSLCLCVAVCYSVLQCVAVCGSVLQFVAVRVWCCSVLQ